MSDVWSARLAKLLQAGKPVVLVTQIGERGSSPRSSGAKMLVTETETFDSLGGGNLEHQAIEHARELLVTRSAGLHELEYTLAGNLGQCCGGEVRVLFEVFNAAHKPLYLFGAGHIAKALVPLISQLSFAVHWIDDRDELFPSQLPDNVNRIERDPVDVASSLPSDAWVLIMTHNHNLDMELLLAAFANTKPEYIGMIGSDTKVLKFKQRMQQRGIDEALINSVHAPIGLAGLHTKLPIEIAISVTADLMQRLQQDQ